MIRTDLLNGMAVLTFQARQAEERSGGRLGHQQLLGAAEQLLRLCETEQQKNVAEGEQLERMHAVLQAFAQWYHANSGEVP